MLGTNDVVAAVDTTAYATYSSGGLYASKPYFGLYAQSSIHRTYQDGLLAQTTETRSYADATYGTTKTLYELGDTAKSSDDRCTTTVFNRNTTAWITGAASAVRTYSGGVDASFNCNGTLVSQEERTYEASPPTVGATRTSKKDVTGAGVWATTTFNYSDPYGRVTSITDPRGNTSSTSFTPTIGYPTTLIATDALSRTTSTTLNRRGAPVSVTDANSKVTTAEYDAAGRLTKVWKPGSSTVASPTVEYQYALNTAWGNPGAAPPTVDTVTPSTVTTKSLVQRGGDAGAPATDAVTTSVAFVDGFGREVHTRAQMTAAFQTYGVVATSTSYDSHGVATKSTAPYAVTNGSDPSVFTTFSSYPATPARESATTYDILGRPVYQDVRTAGTTAQRTTIAYNGIYTTVYPPDSSKSPTRTRIDGFGRVDESAVIDPAEAEPAGPAADPTIGALDTSIVVRSDGSQAVFVVGSDRQVQYRTSNPVSSWSPLTMVGCCGLDRISATALPDGRMVVVARATNNVIYVTRQNANGSWGGWVSLGQSAIDVAVSTNTSGFLVIAFVGTDGAVWMIGENNQTDVWYAPFGLGGGGVTRVSMARYSDGALHVAIITNAANFFTKRQLTPGGAFETAWTMRSCCIYDIAATMSGANPGIFVVSGVGSDGSIYRMWETSRGGSWTTLWQGLGGGPFTNVAAAQLPNGCGVSVGLRSDGTVQTNNESPCGTWSGWVTVARQQPSQARDIATVVKPDGTQAVFQVMPDNQVYLRETNPTTGWTSRTVIGCCGLVKVSALLVNGLYVVAARTVDGHMYVKRQLAGGSWGNWEYLGCCALDVALTTNPSGYLILAYVGADKSVYLMGENNQTGVWYAPISLAGGSVERISAARYPDGSIAIAINTTPGYMFTKRQLAPGGGFEASWNNRGCCVTDVAATMKGSQLVVSGVAFDGSVQRMWESSQGGSWYAWQSLAGSTFVTVSSGQLPSGCGSQVAQKSDGTVWVNNESPCGTFSGWNLVQSGAVTKTTYTTLGATDTVTDPLGAVMDYNYDALGRVTSVSDPNAGYSTVGYDLNGNVTSTVDARGVTLTSTYDALNRPLERKNGATLLTKAVYDAPGQLGLLDWSASYDAGIEYKTDFISYDDAYRPTQTNYVVPASADSSGVAGTYTYKATYRPDGAVLTQTVPAVGGLPAERQTFPTHYSGQNWGSYGQDLDTAGNPTGAQRLYLQGTAYDELGRVAFRQLGDPTGSLPNVRRNYYYDSLGRLSNLWASTRYGNGTDTMVQWDSYSFDANGNVAKKDDAQASQAECFQYDNRNRLTHAFTQATGGCGSTMQDVGPDPYERWFAFDAGNRLYNMEKRTSSTQARSTYWYGYGSSGALAPTGCVAGTQGSKPHATTIVTGVGEMRYDCSGNMTSRTNPGGAWTQVWDAQNRLSQVNQTNGPVSRYIYGPNGQRLIQIAGSTRTLYLPGQEVTSVSGGAATVARYYTAGAGGPTVAMRRTGTNAGTYYMGGDAQGSVSWMVNAATLTVTRARYYPYGQVRGAANAMPTDHGFVGQIEDDTTGLNYLNARYQDPLTGVFLSVDPLVATSGDPYLYASGSPTSRSDPGGLLDTHDLNNIHNDTCGNSMCRPYSAPSATSSGPGSTGGGSNYSPVISSTPWKGTTVSNETAKKIFTSGQAVYDDATGLELAVGGCGSFSAVFWSYDGCLIATADDWGTTSSVGRTSSQGPAVGADATIGVIVSNAQRLSDLEGPAACVSASGGFGGGGAGTVCGSINPDTGAFTGILTVYAGLGFVAGGGPSVSVVWTHVQSWGSTPGLVKWILPDISAGTAVAIVDRDADPMGENFQGRYDAGLPGSYYDAGTPSL